MGLCQMWKTTSTYIRCEIRRLLWSRWGSRFSHRQKQVNKRRVLRLVRGDNGWIV